MTRAFAAGDRFGDLKLLWPLGVVDDYGCSVWSVACVCKTIEHRIPASLRTVVQRGQSPCCAGCRARRSAERSKARAAARKDAA